MNKLVAFGFASVLAATAVSAAASIAAPSYQLDGPKIVFLDKTLTGKAVVAQNGNGKMVSINTYTYEVEPAFAHIKSIDLTAQLNEHLGNGGLTIVGDKLTIQSAKDCGYTLLHSSVFQKTVTATLQPGKTVVVVSNC
jgi:hypothetical protein